MDHFIKLDRLPDGIKFPADLRDRIVYDADRHELHFQGAMSKAEFDRLGRLHDDWGYRRSLEALFRVCTFEDTRPPSGRLATALGRLLHPFGQPRPA